MPLGKGRITFSKLSVETPPTTRRSSDDPNKLEDSGWTDEYVDLNASTNSIFGPVTPASQMRRMQKRSAIMIQRWYRKQVIKYATFGPMIFTRKDGKISDFGRLLYTANSRTAHFLRVSDTTSAATLAHFLEKYWRLRRPDVLISVTGSAASLELTSQLQRVFDRGLAAAASMTNAWIFTGGTDSGVMKLVGDAMHKGGLVDVPLVGIAPFGALHGKSGLENKKGQEVHVTCTRRPPMHRRCLRLRRQSRRQLFPFTACVVSFRARTRVRRVFCRCPRIDRCACVWSVCAREFVIRRQDIPGGRPAEPIPHAPDPRRHGPRGPQVGL